MQILKIEDYKNLYQAGQAVNELIKTQVNDDKCFIITNSQVGSLMMDLEGFRNESFPRDTKLTPDAVYKCGELNNTDVYVDSMMRWDDTRVLIFSKKEGESISEGYKKRNTHQR